MAIDFFLFYETIFTIQFENYAVHTTLHSDCIFFPWV
jgi:hypothetical protein